MGHRSLQKTLFGDKPRSDGKAHLGERSCGIYVGLMYIRDSKMIKTLTHNDSKAVATQNYVTHLDLLVLA